MKSRSMGWLFVGIMVLTLSFLWGCGQNSTTYNDIPNRAVVSGLESSTTTREDMTSQTDSGATDPGGIIMSTTTESVQGNLVESTTASTERASQENSSNTEASDPEVGRPVTEESTEPATQSATGEDTGVYYVININTEKFHYSFCHSVSDIKPQNRRDYHGSREDILAMGYVPCKNCNP